MGSACVDACDLKYDFNGWDGILLKLNRILLIFDRMLVTQNRMLLISDRGFVTLVILHRRFVMLDPMSVLPVIRNRILMFGIAYC